ncbi:MAG: Flp pilus assembly complex ATPase component TadA [Candidatus Omnitrophica bacterium]|nr:Flp pilus assembly complex ATPase component TadA [Candidatus Omnitrophota bacterium]
MVLSLKDRVTKKLLESSIIDQAQLDKALQFQKEKGGKLSQILIDLGYVKQKDLLVTLSQDLNIPLINLSKYNIDPTIIEMVPREIARHYQLIPLSKMGPTITIVVADPLNIFAIDDIKSLTGFDVRLVLADTDDIISAIEQYYGKHTHKEIESVVEEMGEPRIVLSGEEKDLSPQRLIKLTQEVPVVRVNNMILAEAVQLKASDVLIEPMEQETRVRYRIDGLLQNARTLPKSLHEAVVSRIKIMSELNIAERRLPQDGRFKLKIKNRFIDFRVSVLPSSCGEKVALRVLDQQQATLDVEKLGFTGKALEDVKTSAMRPHGMILACGPTGSGKTTTLYSILKYIDSPEKNVITVEDPIEFDLKGINQVSARTEIGLTFAAALRSMLRQDPDIIMVGEVRDFETLDVAVKAALTGHLVLSTLHTNTAPGAITRMVNMGLEPFLISSSVIMIAAQRLVRQICEKCKEPYEIDDEFRNSIGIEDKSLKKFYKGKGCKFCLGTGYKGRIGIIEVLTLDKEIKKLIMDKGSEHELKQLARSSGMLTLREDGIQKAKEGLTTLEEIIRVTVADRKE